jgi:hypothetical protein
VAGLASELEQKVRKKPILCVFSKLVYSRGCGQKRDNKESRIFLFFIKPNTIFLQNVFCCVFELQSLKTPENAIKQTKMEEKLALF